MRTRHLVLVFGLLTIGAAAAGSAWAQVSDAERAAARDLFKQGDELQRAGKFTEALDKFQRAEQVIQAPTNVLRVAECQAALGKLVESAESYRAVVRWTLAPGSPPAFQSAIDQAKGELSQVEPRVPKLLVQTSPASIAGASMVVDGTAVPGALIGEPFPLDPGDHKILVAANGYSSKEQTVTLKEREAKTLTVEMHPLAGAILPAPAASPSSGAVPPPPPAYGAPSSSSSATPPPPAPYEQPAAPKDQKSTRTSILLGAHLGLLIPSGQIPLANPNPTGNGTANLNDVSAAGLGYGLDGGLRAFRQFYLGLSVEHADFAAGKTPASVGATSGLKSDTTSVGLMGAFILEPERPTFYGELGLQERWYSYTPSSGNGQSYNTGELLVGAGLWWPISKWLRLLPLATASFGSFPVPGTTTGDQSHIFVMLGVTGFYNIDL